MSHITTADWPADRQAIRFVVLSRPNRLGLQRIKSLLWEDDAQTFVEQSAHLDTLIASARRRLRQHRAHPRSSAGRVIRAMANRRPLTLTHERLLEAFTYNPEEGTFPRWNAGVSKSNGGDVAGYHDQHTGYWHIELDGRKYKASRLAWFYMSGQWPALVDHANLVKCDDRWANLRLATISQNEANKRIGSRNKSGFKGVHLHKTSGLWRACITVNKVKKFLGYFKDPAVAHSAYREAAVQAFGEFARFE